MLQLNNIRKEYTTDSFTQVALDGVSVAFRDNEFVAILGPSGSGKTTLLNIVGGLDHYDSGDLIIDGISTKQYKDHDWDTYRNNRVGFVFQSYNLIPHQTILSNVELALTLSGVSRSERRERATEALAKVGLGEHINKKPSQLSGGQMQRVAIARALINDPEILLADEPTGALDSKTSVQIMDLLTEIARDRLVVMVTHNPELAEQYATRIVNLADGKITSDSRPYEPTDEEKARLSAKTPRRTSMSFLTALSLSANNLLTKKGRTLMTAFAGSIGIIGIAAILSLANGVNNYIKTVEEDTLSEYPLQITSSGFDMSAMLMGGAGGGDGSEEKAAEEDAAAHVSETGAAEGEGEVRVAKMITSMFASIGTNDLASLKEFLDSGESGIEPYVNAIEYSYSVKPQIYSSNTEKLRQVHPDESMKSLGLGSGNSNNSLMSMTMSTDVFYELPSNPDLYQDQYDIMAGRWPESHNEVVLVLTGGSYISDFMLYTLGLRDSAELDAMIEQFAEEEEVETPSGITSYSYNDILNVTFKLVNAADVYAYDSEFSVWVNKKDDTAYMKNLVENGETISIVGIMKPKENANATMLAAGLWYPASLTNHVIEEAADSTIVKEQLANPDINVITGKPWGEEDDGDTLGFESMFTIDGEALNAAFTINESALAVDMSNAMNLQGGMQNLPDMPAPDLGSMMGSLEIPKLPVNEVKTLITSLMQQYSDYIQAYNAETPPLIQKVEDGIPVVDENGDPVMGVNPAYSPLDPITWLKQPAVSDQITGAVDGMMSAFDLEEQVANALKDYVQTALTTYMGVLASEMETQMTAAMQTAMNQLAHNMANAFHIDEEKMAEAFQMNMSEEELGELMMSLMYTEDATYEGNLKKFGYAKLSEPSSIDIFPIDFESKEHIIAILDDYNDRMEAEDQKEKVITYTDLVGTLMSSVTNIINAISYVLIAFVAISLVVSSIMIGVITYISVLERKKEIGILRAIGASKKDIGRVFNAETIIVGLTAGLIGVTVTAIACIPVSAFVLAEFDVPNVAQLPLEAAVILVVISVFLTFLSGLIPSGSASRKDPVEALRSE